MPKYDIETIRESLCQQGLNGAELKTAVLAFKIANKLPLGDAAEVEAIAELRQLVAKYLQETSERKIS